MKWRLGILSQFLAGNVLFKVWLVEKRGSQSACTTESGEKFISAIGWSRKRSAFWRGADSVAERLWFSTLKIDPFSGGFAVVVPEQITNPGLAAEFSAAGRCAATRTTETVGGAGNVALNLAGLGAQVSVAGNVGNDEAGTPIEIGIKLTLKSSWKIEMFPFLQRLWIGSELYYV